LPEAGGASTINGNGHAGEVPTHAPELRDKLFDVVFTSYGVLSWLPDLAEWAQVIVHFLKPGATFYIVHRHPFDSVLFPRIRDDAGNPREPGYFSRLEPVRTIEHGSYADPEAEVWTTAYYWSHGIGEIVTALCDAGLHVEYLHEFPPSAIPLEAASSAPPERDDYPKWFSIRARRPL
jgi:SAM-dependent methyltransferase